MVAHAKASECQAVAGHGDVCACIIHDPEARRCLGDCQTHAATILCDSIILSELSRATPAVQDVDELQSAAENIRVDGELCATRRKNCVQRNRHVIACLAAGTRSECECVARDAGAEFCLGECFREVVKALCSSDTHGSDDSVAKNTIEPPAITSYDNQCSKSTLMGRIAACVEKDPIAVECISTIKDHQSECECIMKSSHIRNCLGAGCFEITESLIC